MCTLEAASRRVGTRQTESLTESLRHVSWLASLHEKGPKCPARSRSSETPQGQLT
jgi:hypothetical protein